MTGMKSSLRFALLMFLVVGVAGTAGADAGLFDYTNLAYIAADNFLLLCVVLSAGLGIAAQAFSTTRQYAIYAGLVAMAASIVISAGLLSVKTPLTVYQVLLVMAVGASVGISTTLICKNPEGKISAGVSVQTPLVHGALWAWIAITAMLRFAAPGTAILTWLMAAALLLFVPGFSLAVGLLPAGTGWTQYLLYAIPLSLGVYLISLAWLIQFSIVVTPATFFLIALATTGGGYALSRFTHRAAVDLP